MHVIRWLHLRAGGITRARPRGCRTNAHHSNSHCAEATSCKPHLELPVLTLSSLCFIHRTIIDPPGRQLSDRMSSRCRPTGSALVSASSHIHEDVTGHDRGSLRCPVKTFPGTITTSHPRPHSLLLNSASDHQTVLKGSQ